MKRGAVMVVDDEELNRLLLRTYLGQQGHDVEVAVDGHDALRLLEARPFDVILLDIVMPELDGYGVLERLMEHPELQHVPVIVISGVGEMESVIRCIEMGATDFLPKPFDPVLLKARLNASLAKKRLRDVEQHHLREVEAMARQLEARNLFIKSVFGRYLSDEVVAKLLESPAALDLGGEKRVISILMSDLRGFSALSERLAPEQVVRIINNYLGTMADVIMEHGGTIDEFLGDGALVLFGAPVARADDARRAVACALSMQKAMETVNARNREEGLPEVAMGVAVNTGEVVVGNIGSARRTKYGVVGSHVNLTARIESCSVGGQVLVSDATLRAAGPDAIVGASFDVQAKGFVEPIRVHELHGLGGERPLALARVEAALCALADPAPVTVTVLMEKQLGRQAHPGTIVRLSCEAAELETPLGLAPLANVRLRFRDPGGAELPADCYAKVLAGSRGEHAYRLRFTSIPFEVGRLIDRLLASQVAR